MDNTKSTQQPAALIAGFIAALAVTAAQPAAADAISDTHIFRFGLYEQEIDVRASATRKPLPKQEIEFDRALGLEDSSETYFLEYQWRFGEKWSLEAYYSQMAANGRKITSRDFTWDGQEYTAGLGLKTEFELDTLLAAVNYAFIRDDKKELGLGAGLHAFDIKTTIDISASVADQVSRGSKNNAELLAPLPNLRAFGNYLITPKWSLSGTLAWLSFDYGDFDGSYTFFNLLTEYRFTERFGVGLSYQWSNIDVERDTTHGSKSFDVDMYGPSVFLTYGF